MSTNAKSEPIRFAATLDPPGETRRQVGTLLIWVFFLALAVVAAATVGTHVPASIDPMSLDPDSHALDAELQRSRLARLKVAFVVGLLAPAIATLLLSRWHKKNGGHARGICVEVTENELRMWGRGYGSRVGLADLTWEERLVDVYAGRLGAWRQIRLRLRSRHNTIELAAPARAEDDRHLRLEGGEGDCIELDREDYEAIKAELARRHKPPTADTNAAT